MASTATSTSTPTPTPSVGSLSITEPNESLEQQPYSRVCRYFNRSGSCRAGNSCAYLHEDGQEQFPDAPVIPIERKTGGRVAQASGSRGAVVGEGMVQDRQQAVTEPVSARVVPKPIPQAQTQDPREFQLGQIRRRFRPKETSQAGKTILKFNIVPSDPDFPFEMAELECLLTVPETYPRANPTLKVGNKEIPRGFTVNIEDGFDGLVQARPNATLLELMKSLDKNLETFLSAPKADTVKLVPNKDTRHLSAVPTRAVEPVPTAPKNNAVAAASKRVEREPPKPVQVFTNEEKSDAAKRRESEIRQLEARMGRIPLFRKSADAIAYTIPIEPRKRVELPILIQSVKAIRLFVPLLYPLQPCRIQLDGVDSEAAKPVVRGFEKKSSEQYAMTLMGRVNYLAQNMHILAKTFLETENKDLAQLIEEVALEETRPKGKEKQLEGVQDPERSHIQYIARPSEWTTIDSEDLEYSDSDELYSYDTDGDSEEEGGATISQDEPVVGHSEPTQEKGTAVSFPFMELYGIELFEIAILNITVKCERCKETTEVKGLTNGVAKAESCKKCATAFTIGFRREFIHQNAVRAGFLDLEGCFVADMLPSTFIPTCSQCSTSYPLPGIVSVQGENTNNVCRECHQKFSFKIHSVKFLRITSGSRLPPTSGPRRKKEVLGITPGSELPRRGRCRHYAKSYRWFRFSCCEKVYPCDKCHDEKEDHPNEWANRMICGWCSREGNYRPEDCGVCHSVLIGKKGGGFWEGGKGTRDKVKMSRKDKHKYRRLGAAKIKV